MCQKIWAGVSPSPIWPNMYSLWKVDKKIGQGGPPPPHLDKIQKNSYFFFVKPSLTVFASCQHHDCGWTGLTLAAVLCTSTSVVSYLLVVLVLLLQQIKLFSMIVFVWQQLWIVWSQPRAKLTIACCRCQLFSPLGLWHCFNHTWNLSFLVRYRII